MGSNSNEHDFSESYLILKPEHASLVDLFLFLLPFKLRKRAKFIDFQEGEKDFHTKSSFAHRRLIFISVLMQITLLSIATPLAKLDDFLVLLLNFLSFNGGVLGILFKILTGERLVTPDENSPQFTSVAGFIDWRRELDKSIKPDDTFKYYSHLTMMASKVAYESKPFVQSIVNDSWKMKFLDHFNFWNDFQDKATTQAFMFQADQNVTVVAFRGTSPLDAYDWQVDMNFSWFDIKNVGRIHSGFMKALGLQQATGWPKELIESKYEFAYYTLRQKLRDIAKSNENAKFIITGHSLGAALAILFVTILSLHEESAVLEKLQAIYTYGQPRVGDRRYAKFMINTVKKYGFKYNRFVYSIDMVPRVPAVDTIFKYRHFGTCIYFNSLYKGKILMEQPDKNYFSLIWIIPKYLNAWWELIRSFMISFIMGCDYTESLPMIGARFFGLIIPGISAHLPTDYVNSTRLGRLPKA